MSEKISLYNLYKENTLKLLKTMDLSSQLNLLLSLDTKITIIDFTCLFPIKYNYYTVNTQISVYLVNNPKLLKKELFSSSDFIIFLVDNFLVKEVLEFLDEKCLINFIEFI